MDNCSAFLGASDPGEQRLVNIAGTYEHLAGVGGLEHHARGGRAVDGLVHRYLLAGPLPQPTLAWPLGHLLAEVEAAAPAGSPD